LAASAFAPAGLLLYASTDFVGKLSMAQPPNISPCKYKVCANWDLKTIGLFFIAKSWFKTYCYVDVLIWSKTLLCKFLNLRLCASSIFNGAWAACQEPQPQRRVGMMPCWAAASLAIASNGEEIN
jgi:hypothetical protein